MITKIIGRKVTDVSFLFWCAFEETSAEKQVNGEAADVGLPLVLRADHAEVLRPLPGRFPTLSQNHISWLWCFQDSHTHTETHTHTHTEFVCFKEGLPRLEEALGLSALLLGAKELHTAQGVGPCRALGPVEPWGRGVFVLLSWDLKGSKSLLWGALFHTWRFWCALNSLLLPLSSAISQGGKCWLFWLCLCPGILHSCIFCSGLCCLRQCIRKRSGIT